MLVLGGRRPGKLGVKELSPFILEVFFKISQLCELVFGFLAYSPGNCPISLVINMTVWLSSVQGAISWHFIFIKSNQSVV